MIGPNGAARRRSSTSSPASTTRRGRHPARRQDHRRPPTAPDLPARYLAHVPDAAAVPEHVREGERHGRGIRPYARGRLPLDPAHAGHAPRGEGDRRLAEERLSFFGDRLMGYRWNQPAYCLSYANRRRLEIARATATKPRRLAARRAGGRHEPVETHEITELIGRLREEGGYTILVIEHDMHVVEGISDRVVALDHGVKISEGTFDHVATARASSRRISGRRRRRRNDSATDEPSRCSRSTGSTRTTARSTSSRAVPARRAGRARLPARRQCVGQVDDAEDDPRDRQAAQRHGALRRRGRDEPLDELPDQAGHGDRAGEPPALRADERAREPPDGRLPARRRVERRTSSASTSSSRCSTSAARSSPARCRAASSRWSRWVAR